MSFFHYKGVANLEFNNASHIQDAKKRPLLRVGILYHKIVKNAEPTEMKGANEHVYVYINSLSLHRLNVAKLGVRISLRDEEKRRRNTDGGIFQAALTPLQAVRALYR